jgi:hypothetical protein
LTLEIAVEALVYNPGLVMVFLGIVDRILRWNRNIVFRQHLVKELEWTHWNFTFVFCYDSTGSNIEQGSKGVPIEDRLKEV